MPTLLQKAEGAAAAVANALSRFHVQINGWLALGALVAANLVGVFLHV